MVKQHRMSGLDSGAYPLLMGAMVAASIRDEAALILCLDAAELYLPQGRWHKSRPEMAAARQAAAEGNWDTAWLKCHHALCGLTTMFPPDLTMCPPAPSERNTVEACANCAAELTARSRFCAHCGAPVTA